MLVACERCKRHISIGEDACPFCRHSSALARGVGAAALSAGVLLAGCDAGKDKKPEQGSAAVEKRPYATIHGAVKDRNDKPIANTMLTITSTDDPSGVRTFSRSVPTDATGHYKLDLLPPGAYSLWVAYNRSVGQMELTGDVQRPITVLAGDDKEADFSVELREMKFAPPYGAPPRRRIV